MNATMCVEVKGTTCQSLPYPYYVGHRVEFRLSGLASLPREPSLDYKTSDRQGLNTLTYTTQNTILQSLVNILYTGMCTHTHTFSEQICILTNDKTA